MTVFVVARRVEVGGAATPHWAVAAQRVSRIELRALAPSCAHAEAL